MTPQTQEVLLQEVQRVEQELHRLLQHLQAMPDDARASIQCGMSYFKLSTPQNG